MSEKKWAGLLCWKYEQQISGTHASLVPPVLCQNVHHKVKLIASDVQNCTRKYVGACLVMLNEK